MAHVDDLTDRLLTTARAAAALGISAATLKRYVDDGLLRAERTPKGHRRIRGTEIVRVVREGRFPNADLTELLGSASPPGSPGLSIKRPLAEAIRDDDTDAVRGLLLGSVRSGVSIPSLADEVIAPTMRQIGHGWETGRIGVMDEHLGTQALLTAVYQLRSSMKGEDASGRPVAVGGAPEGDPYILPTLLAEMALFEQGWNAINLGPHTPFEAFTDSVETHRPRLVWISVSHLPDPESFLRGYAAFHEFARRGGVAVVVGGRALTAAELGRMRFAAHGDGLTRLTDFATTLLGRPPRPKRGRPKLPG